MFDEFLPLCVLEGTDGDVRCLCKTIGAPVDGDILPAAGGHLYVA